MRIEILNAIDDTFDEVVSLGTRNSKTLGHFPEGAYREYANRKQIFVALSDDGSTLLGFVLFAITQSKSRIRITQLCIDSKFRKQGIAVQLLDSVKNKYQNLFRGMALSCRKDYKEASAFWLKYGFKALDEIRSRSKKENYLIKWWFDFGNNDLFTLSHEHSKKTRAVLDANVIIHLRDSQRGEKKSCVESSLLADWLSDEVEFMYAPEFFNEVYRDTDSQRASESRAFCAQFTPLKFKPEKRDRIFNELAHLISGDSENDRSDRMQLAECIASGVEFFITSDTGILDHERSVYESHRVQVVSPVDFIVMLDEQQNSDVYQFTRLSGVNMDYGKLKHGEMNTIVQTFLRKSENERKQQFKAILDDIAAKPRNSIVNIARLNRSYEGVWAAVFDNHSLNVEVIRTSKSIYGNLLFKQLVKDIIQRAVSLSVPQIIITEQKLDLKCGVYLQEAGFFFTKSGWRKVVLQQIFPSIEKLLSTEPVPQVVNAKRILEKVGSDPNPIPFKFEMEQKFWPAKLYDVNVPCYVIPIRRYWASELFDYYLANEDLFGSRPELAWNRENVYYRSVNPVSEQAPGRILWYVSSSYGANSARTSAIVATSYLEEVSIGPATDLFKKYRHYGVYEWKDALEVAKGSPYGLIKAIKFSDTEVFKQPIPFKEIVETFNSFGRSRNTFASPVTIDKDIYFELYKKGIN